MSAVMASAQGKIPDGNGHDVEQGRMIAYKEVARIWGKGRIADQPPKIEPHFKETDVDKPIMCKLDGSPPTSLSGTRTMAVKLDGPPTLKMTYSNDGTCSVKIPWS